MLTSSYHLLKYEKETGRLIQTRHFSQLQDKNQRMQKQFPDSFVRSMLVPQARMILSGCYTSNYQLAQCEWASLTSIETGAEQSWIPGPFRLLAITKLGLEAIILKNQTLEILKLKQTAVTIATFNFPHLAKIENPIISCGKQLSPSGYFTLPFEKKIIVFMYNEQKGKIQKVASIKLPPPNLKFPLPIPFFLPNDKFLALIFQFHSIVLLDLTNKKKIIQKHGTWICGISPTAKYVIAHSSRTRFQETDDIDLCELRESSLKKLPNPIFGTL